jgi:two-component system, cell cycle sensor histidine kinase and response regulator CckA
VEFRSPKGRVLFVDDEARITQMAEQVLRSQGFEVTALTSAVQALAAFLADPRQFDAVVLDHTMPELSGLELAQRISSIRPELPIVLLSGFAEGLSRAALQKAGVARCLPKPLPLSQLGELLHGLLQREA